MVGSQEDVGSTINNQAVPLNTPLLRLADVYLVYAEAEIGSGASTSDATAINYLNAVRTRGNSPVAARNAPLTYEQVFNERRVEFGFEGINWFDVKRRFYRNQGDAISYINGQSREVTMEAIDGFTGDRNSYEAFELNLDNAPVSVSPEEFFLPIPSDEVTQNPKLAPGVEPVVYEFDN